MKKRSQQHDELSPQPICENCIHAFRQHVEPEMAICIPHLKVIRLKTSPACELLLNGTPERLSSATTVHLDTNDFRSGGEMPAEISGHAAVCLSDIERARFLDIIEPSMHIGTQDEFLKWTQTELQTIFPHGKLVCGVGRLGSHGVHIRHVMGWNFPDEYIQSLQRPDGLSSSPIIAKWMREQQPVLFEPDCEEIIKTAPPGWLDNFHRFGLVNLAAHGIFDFENHTASYFSFSCIPGPLNQRHAYLLRLLVPHLHAALTRVVSNPQFSKKHRRSTYQVKLTKREKEILQWMTGGKSNWEIAQVIGLSESTVKNHVHHILGKLHSGSRAQAVAKAINHKLISAMH